MKIVVGSTAAAGTDVAGPPSVRCCPELPEQICAVLSLSLTDSQFRLKPAGFSGDAASHVLTSAFLCFLPPRLLFRRVGTGSVLEVPGASAGVMVDCVRHGLSNGADHGSQGDMYPPPLGHTPPAAEPPSCFRS